jgi:diadenosine tetraphosphate (Ap4A) HIT family hydrolase
MKRFVIALYLLCVGSLFAVDPSQIVHEGATLTTFVPWRPLADKSVQLSTFYPKPHLTDWSQEEHAEAYYTLQKIAGLWHQVGLADAYMIFGKDNLNEITQTFTWEAIPYPPDKWRQWNQLKVLWNVSFGAIKLSPEAMDRTVKFYTHYREYLEQPLEDSLRAVSDFSITNDALGDPTVIERQWLYKGRTMNVLYNYAPNSLGEHKLHFLIVPIERRRSFGELTLEEYLEQATLTSAIIRLIEHEFSAQSIYMMEKVGRQSGQSEGRHHRHLIFSTSNREDLWGKFQVLKNGFFYPKPLPRAELEKQVSQYRRLFENLDI